MHEQKERLRFEHKKDSLLVGIVIKVLVHAAIFYQHDVVGFPLDATAIVNIVSAAFDHEEDRTVKMPMFLPIGARRIGLDMGFDRLGNLSSAWAGYMFPEYLRTALPGYVAFGVYAWPVKQFFSQVAVSALQSADKDALFFATAPKRPLAPDCVWARVASRRIRSTILLGLAFRRSYVFLGNTQFENSTYRNEFRTSCVVFRSRWSWFVSSVSDLAPPAKRI